MKPQWIIENNVFQDGTSERMGEIAKSRGMKVLHVDSDWVHGRKFGGSNFIHAHECAVFYGSMNMARKLLRENAWTPTAWFNLKTLACTDYYANWGQYLLQQDYLMMPWAEMKRKKEFLYAKMSDRHPYAPEKIFLRPNSNTKLFTGTVLERDEFEHFIKMTDECYTPDPETLVIVARVQDISDEWRFIVSEGKVLTGSYYGKNSDGAAISINIDNYENRQEVAARNLALKIAKEQWQPDIIYALDICAIRSGGPSNKMFGPSCKLLEIGSVNTAAMYGCNLEIVVDKVSELAEKEHADNNIEIPQSIIK